MSNSRYGTTPGGNTNHTVSQRWVARLLSCLILLSPVQVFALPGPAVGQTYGRSIILKQYLHPAGGCYGSAWTSLVGAKSQFGGSLLFSAPTTRGASTAVQNVYGFNVTRIGGVTGGAFSATGFGSQGTVPWNNTISGTFGKDSRHHYTKDSPWNNDGSLYMLQNPSNTQDTTNSTVANGSATGSTELILRTSDWSVTTYGQCIAGGDSIRDRRWMPPGYNPNWMVVLKQTSSGASNDTAYSGGDYVGIIDVTTCKIIRRTPIMSEGGNKIIRANLIGAGEGELSLDGTKLVLCALHRQNNFTRPDSLQVVNLTTMTLGTAFEALPCSLEVDASPSGGSDNQKMDCNIGHVAIAPSGNRGWILYASDDAQDGAVTIDTTDAIRVFDISGTTISGFHAFDKDTVWRGPTNNGVRAMCATSLIGGANTVANSYGWISNLKHATGIADPYTAHDCIVGGQRCGRSGNEGQMEMVDIQTGRMKRLTSAAGVTESSIVHTSARNQFGAPGWAVISYDDANGTSPQAELVMVRTDGLSTPKVIRLAETRTRDNFYRAEAHPVMDWYGSKLAWASDWVYNCATCGVQDSPKDYYIDLSSLCLP